MSELIAAPATGRGVSAIGIIRLSGDGAIAAVDRLFHAVSGKKMADTPSRSLVYGALRDASGALLDMCLCTVSRAPASFTGEETAELQCHGSPVALSMALEALFDCGARMAEPGEFTKRAFLNGKLDLTEAEAVIDLIEADTPAAAKNASAQLGGAVTRRTDAVYSALLDIMAHFHAVVDWPDEDIEDFESAAYLGVIRDSRETLRRLLDTFKRGRVLRDGVRCVIVGRPNVGKSSLMNALVGFDRAIVTSAPGTTRDTVEERVILGGVPVRLTDTAGLRETSDEAEKQGVLRAESAAESAELVIGVFDGSEPLTPEDSRTLKAIEAANNALAVVNKSDLPKVLSLDIPFISVSAATGEGIDALSESIGELFRGQSVPQGEILTNARQAGEVRRALDALSSAEEALCGGMTPDAVLTEIEEAIGALGRLSGRTPDADVTERIFRRFCVGK